jgi:hypothetical protein
MALLFGEYPTTELSIELLRHLFSASLAELNSQLTGSVRVTYGWRFIANQFVLATSPLRLQLNTCGYSPYVTPSLTRGWACRLQLLLGLASAVFLRPESRRTHDHILLSQIPDSPNLEGQVPVFISPRNRLAQLYPQALGSLFLASYDSKGYGESIRLTEEDHGNVP